MVRADFQQGAAAPRARRDDVAAVLRQQLSYQACWWLPIRAITGQLDDWINQYVLTEAVMAMVPARTSSVRIPALRGAFAQGIAQAEISRRIARVLMPRVYAAVSGWLRRLVARYVAVTAIGSSLMATGLGSLVGLSLDMATVYLVVDDVVHGREELIEIILEAWYE